LRFAALHGLRIAQAEIPDPASTVAIPAILCGDTPCPPAALTPNRRFWLGTPYAMAPGDAISGGRTMLRLAVPTCLVLAFTLAHPAAAETMNRSLSGKRLELRMACPTHIEIQPRSDLVDTVEIDASADDQAALDTLHVSGGDVVAIERRGHCHSDDLDDSAFELTLHVPPGLAIEIGDSSAGAYEIGDVGGPLKMHSSGAAELHAERLSGLDLDSAGATEIRIDRLDGPGTVALHGGGELTIRDGRMPSLRLESRGAGEIQVEDGEIGTLSISLAGAGDAEIQASVRDATLEILGIGNISVDKVSGKVSRKILGLGNIDIGS
jgi:hypothetical protein